MRELEVNLSSLSVASATQEGSKQEGPKIELVTDRVPEISSIAQAQPCRPNICLPNNPPAK